MMYFNHACESCQRALLNPLSARFQARCFHCQARMLAHSPQFFQSSLASAITPEYRKALLSLGGDVKETHEIVKTWAGNINNAKRQKN